MRARRVLGIALGTIATILALVLIAVLVLTNTDVGRGVVRRQLVSLLQGKIHGVVRVGRVEGNLLTGMTVHDLSITDSNGVPFLAAQQVKARYRLRNFLDQKLWFTDVVMVKPLLMFDKPPGGEWNTKRLFPDTPHPPGYVHVPGYGDWFALYDARVIDGRIVVRAPWKSSDTLTLAQRDSAAKAALAGGTRLVVIQVPGGYQKVTEIRAVNGTFPRVILADWDRHEKNLGRLIEVSEARFVAQPFQPPVIDVRYAKGVFEFNSDSLWFQDARARLPNSDVVVEKGWYNSNTDGLRITAHASTASFADFRWVYPRFPSTGGGTLDFRLIWDSAGGDDYLVRRADVRTGGAHALGDFGVTLRHDSVIFHDVAVKASGIDTRLVEQLAPAVKIPRRGTIDGRLTMAGPLQAVRLDADLAFNDAQAGRSRVMAIGEAGVAAGGIRARDLRLNVQPFQLALVHILLPTFPVGGTVNGRATVTGAGRNWRVADADLTHVERGDLSRVTGDAEVRLAGATWVNVNLRAHPVSLVTVGRFMPAVGLQGAATGPIRIQGPMRDLAVNADLTTSDGGQITARGRLDLASAQKGYDLAVGAQLFNAHAVLARAPRTSVTATARATGRGFSPATMNATVSGDVKSSTLDSLTVDSARVRATIAGGLLQLNDLTARGPGTTIVAKGALGLAAGREGTLAFNVQVDSLEKFSRWLPKDTGYVAPRPGVAARQIEQARADSARLAQATEVTRAISGGRPPVLKVDTATAVRRDSIAGAVYAAGTVSGSLVSGFDLRGRAGVQNLLVLGNKVHRARSEFAWLRARTPEATMVVAAQADSAMVKGFEIDSADVRFTLKADSGNVQAVVRQYPGPTERRGREYALKADYALLPDRHELRFDQVRLQFDTTVWRSTRPGAVQWGPPGIVFRTVELRNQQRGRIYVNGMIGADSSAHLDLALDQFEIGDIVALAQTDVHASGKLTLAARVDGTTHDPRVSGALALNGATYGGTAIPDLRGTLAYANAKLTSKLEASRGGAPLARVASVLPVNLAAGAVGPRLDRTAPLQVDIDADSLPLDVLPKLTDAVTDVRGRAMGAVRVRGSIGAPEAVGALALDLGSFRVVPNGMRVRDLVGYMRIQGDTVIVDSLAGFASGGRVRVTGGIGIADLLHPAMDLQVAAHNALVLDTDQGRARADAQLAIFGPFERVYVSGTVRVRNGVLYIPESDHKETISAGDPAVFNVIDTSVVSDRELMPAQSPLLANLRMDIGLRVDRDTWVRSKDANVEVYSDGDLVIHVDRRRQALALEGVLGTDRGEYTYLGKRFQVTRGSATFIGTPELNPTLQATAEYEVRIPGREALFIRLVIGGTLQSLNLALESDAQPPIPQSDLISYLAFGRSSSSLLQVGGSSLGTGNSGGGVVGSVGALASQQLASVALDAAVSELEGQAARSLGADVFNITPADLPAEVWRPDVSAFFRGTEIEYGKYLTTRNYLAFQGRPLDPQSVPGLRYQLRESRGLRVELSFEPRYLLQEPTLGVQPPVSTGVFGAFVIREWRF